MEKSEYLEHALKGRTIILPAALYGFETRPHTLMED
jgi:hypothetical protein